MGSPGVLPKLILLEYILEVRATGDIVQAKDVRAREIVEPG